MMITNEDDGYNGKYGGLFYFISFPLIVLSPFGHFLKAAGIIDCWLHCFVFPNERIHFIASLTVRFLAAGIDCWFHLC